jgi:hypothetical protein
VTPTSISHALRLDKIDGNILWQEAIQREMDQLEEYKTFRVPTMKEDFTKYQHIPYHNVFDCQFDGRQKGRLVEKYPEYDNWKEFYPEAKEETSDGIPEPNKNQDVQVTIMVDADHAHCEVTRRSVTGILLFINSTLVR